MPKKTPQKTKAETPKVTPPEAEEYENTTKRDIFTIHGRLRPGECVKLFKKDVFKGLEHV